VIGSSVILYLNGIISPRFFFLPSFTCRVKGLKRFHTLYHPVIYEDYLIMQAFFALYCWIVINIKSKGIFYYVKSDILGILNEMEQGKIK
jgi:hypothetical protein